MRSILLLLALVFAFALNAQITGTITDNKGEPLPFASVYVQGSSQGTTSNVNGDYRLELKPGNYQLVFQYVGYKQKILPVNLSAQSLKLDVQLQEEAIELSEIVVKADAEDPAYAVIRQAIAKRQYYRDLVEAYSCQVYIKGHMKMLDAPEKIMGQDVGDLDGSLDSNRQGIIYLSESESNFYVKQPDLKKEVMISSKVSGDDNGFSFNSAMDIDLNLYENTIPFLNRSIISPIANNALQYYRYRLVGTLFDEEGRLINKIELLPKRSEDPAYRGYIYIVEDLWNIQSADMLLTAGASKLPGLDSLFIQQVYMPVQEPDVWRLLSQTFRFRIGFLGFKMGGDFTGVYTNYNLQPNLPDNFFSNEIFKVEEGANEKGLEYWQEIRPIPLTQEESIDYVRKDSLQELRKSKPYLDSLDRKNNKFTFFSLLTGYNFSRSYERKYFSVGSPLATVQFNPVQGFYGDLTLNYRQDFDEERTHTMNLGGAVQYGLGDKAWRAEGNFQYDFNDTNFAQLSLNGGLATRQFNADKPISPTLATLYALFDKQNLIKIYEKAYAQIGWRQEIANGVLLTAAAEYAQRRPLTLHSDYSFVEREDAYASNNPEHPTAYRPSFTRHEAVLVAVSLRLRYKQHYLSYPKRKFIVGSKLPDLWIHYRKGIPLSDGDADFDHVAVQIRETHRSLGLLGSLSFNVEAGTFLNKSQVYFMDYKHFNGNETFIGTPSNYYKSFFLLPYYSHSTSSDYVQAHLEHSFQGFLLDKIPGIRKLGWYTVLGGKFLYTAEQPNYTELSLGFDNIGFGIFRLFRVDGAVALKNGKYRDWGVVFGLTLPVN